MLKKIKEHKYLFITLMLNFVILFIYGVKHNFILTIYGDSFEQIFKIFYGAYDNVRNFYIKFWDFNPLFGMNYYASNAWYGIFSPFFYLTIFLSPTKQSLIYTIYFMHIVKISLFLFFSYIWLNKVYDNKLASAVASFSIAYSSYFLTSIYAAAFIDVYIYIPLLLFFIEEFLEKKKTFSITMTIFLISIDNYYYLYIFIPFVCLYILVRYLLINKFVFRIFIKDALKFIFASFLGILLSSFVLLPVYEVIKETGRTTFEWNFNFIGFKNLYRHITSFFINIGNWRDNHNYFISIDTHKGISYGGGFSNFSSYFFLYCLIIFLFDKFKKEKIAPLVLLILYSIFPLFFISYYIFNLSLETRWLINLMWINALVVCYVIKNIKDIKTRILGFSFLVVCFMMVLFLFITIKLKFTSAFWEVDVLYRNFIFAIVVFVFYVIILNKKKFFVVLLVLLSFENFYQLYNLFYNMKEINQPISKSYYDDFLAKDEVFEYLKRYDDGFYRISYVDHHSDYYINDPIAFNYNGFSFYHSIFDRKQKNILENTFFYGAPLSFTTNDKQFLKNKLGSKYLVTKEEAVKFYDYSFLKKINNYYIYENKHPFSFAYANTKLVNDEQFHKLYNHHKDYYSIGHTYHATFLGKLDLENIFNSLEKDGDIYSLKKDDFIYVICTYGVGNKLKDEILILDSQKNKIKKLDNLLSFYKDVFVLEGEKYLQNHNDGFIFESLDLKNYLKKYEELKPYFSKNIRWGRDFIEADIELDKDDFVVTSIAYSDNFKLYVDGERKEFLMVNDGFIGFPINKGRHSFLLKYEIKGLKEGLILSFVALIIIVLKKCYLIIKK